MKIFSQIPKSLQTINFDSGSRQVLYKHVWAHLRIKRRRHFQTGKKLVCNPHTRNYFKYCMRTPCRQMYINKKWYIRSWPWYTNMRIFGPLVALICLAVKILSASEEGRHFSIFKILFSHVITYFNRFWYLIFFYKINVFQIILLRHPGWKTLCWRYKIKWDELPESGYLFSFDMAPYI